MVFGPVYTYVNIFKKNIFLGLRLKKKIPVHISGEIIWQWSGVSVNITMEYKVK